MSTKNQHTGPGYEAAKIEAVNLWLGGSSYAAIARHQQCAVSTAHQRVKAALDDMRPHHEYDQYIARQIAELELARTRLVRLIVSDPEQLIQAVVALIKLQDREAKLLGLDKAPTPVETEIARLRAMSDEELAAEVQAWATDVSSSGD